MRPPVLHTFFYLCTGLNVQSMNTNKNMTRRDALKTMGAIVATAALTTTGLSAFAAPVNNQNAPKSVRTAARLCRLPKQELHHGRRGRVQGRLEYCLACVHNCPQKALTLHRERNPQARYRNENVSLGDIKRANNQQ